MESEKGHETKVSSFSSPKLPFAWLASSFFLPLAIFVLPPLITDAEMTWEVRAIIALAIFSVFLLVSCILMAYGRYEEAYARQAFQLEYEYRLENLKFELAYAEKRGEKLDEIIKVIQEYISVQPSETEKSS